MQITKKEIFKAYAPEFNFEFNEDELLVLALEYGFVYPVEGEEDLYLINKDY